MTYWLLLGHYLLAFGAAGGGDGFSTLFTFLPIIIIVFLYIVLLQRPSRRDQQARQAMLANLKKNDHVLTTSGIYGVVTNVQPEADEVTLRVDETSGAKLRVTLTSIAKVLNDASGTEKSSK